MRRILLSALFTVCWGSLIKADDIMMTGPKAEVVKKEILDLLKEEIQAFQKGSAIADFTDRHDVDSLLYLGGTLSDQTKTRLVNEWRTGAREMVKANHHDFRVRVYDDGNLAVVDFIGGSWTRFNGKDLKGIPDSIHILRVYAKHDGIWRTIVQDVTPRPVGTEKRP